MTAVSSRFATTLAAMMIVASTALVRADRAPDAQERAAIEAALREQGYVAWNEIERDDGVWEIDDARRQSGAVFDLELDATSLRVVKEERED